VQPVIVALERACSGSPANTISDTLSRNEGSQCPQQVLVKTLGLERLHLVPGPGKDSSAVITAGTVEDISGIVGIGIRFYLDVSQLDRFASMLLLPRNKCACDVLRIPQGST
jgi:hypothetical protein